MRGWMRFSAAAAMAGLVLAPAASAQAAASCAALKQAMQWSLDEVKANRGAFDDQDDSSTSYAAKTGIPGFGPCTITSDKDVSTYEEHTLKCDGEMADTATAISFVTDVYACMKDGFSEREAHESHIDGRWRMVEFGGEWTKGAPEQHALFGDKSYSRIALESQFGGSEELNVHIWYYFLK